MNINFTNSVLALAVCATLAACGGSGNSKNTTTSPTAPTVPEVNESGISAIPDTLKATYTPALKFDRYTKVDTPNGGAIHIVAQDQITENQIVRSRNILQHFLTDFPGSQYGEDKSAVANKMAENGATLMLLNGVDDGTNAGAELDGQPLYYGEIQVEGHSWYINQNYEHRDASYEEILHLVHDYGIGIDQGEEFIGASAEYQAEIRAAQTTALSGQLWAWGAEQADWLAELTAENSLTQEYLASVVDSFYGLWGAHESEYGMWGFYIAKTRDDLPGKDPQGSALMDMFFHPYLTYNARIDESFTGDFSLKFQDNLPYTHHARYLKDVTLTGSNDSNVLVNELNNNISGNTGTNTVVFSGPSSEYQISKEGDSLTVTDLQDGRDGSNTLEDIEKLKFTDTTIESSSL
ncbi:hypothetical protein SG34_030655 [Thalassomonas viridans]|uniref:Lipoprotein n=1 Tax=Thalassomonas viridans TaxID=137584 RepID=A0AAE9ZAX4_9GAMM|nr:hypothetical protein [Thalassomonas viridans]WDE09129.1 hypothetical protein SG34_030655 [Thalassomonas viridans]